MCLVFIIPSSVVFGMLMSTIEYKHSYLNIIVAVVFVAKIVVDFGEVFYLKVNSPMKIINYTVSGVGDIVIRSGL